MYIDPGTGSIIVQAILAAVLSAGVLIKIFWKRITTFFHHQGKAYQSESDTKETKKEQG